MKFADQSGEMANVGLAMVKTLFLATAVTNPTSVGFGVQSSGVLMVATTVIDFRIRDLGESAFTLASQLDDLLVVARWCRVVGASDHIQITDDAGNHRMKKDALGVEYSGSYISDSTQALAEVIINTPPDQTFNARQTALVFGTTTLSARRFLEGDVMVTPNGQALEFVTAQDEVIRCGFERGGKYLDIE